MKPLLPVRVISLISIILIVPEIMATPAFSLEKQSTAFIGDFAGQVFLIQTEDANPRQVSVGQTLYEGDQVRLAESASATICYLDGREPVKHSGPATVSIGPSQPSGAQAGKTKILFQKVHDFLTGNKKVRLTTELSLRGSNLENQEIIPLTPVSAKIWGKNLADIIFEWEDCPLYPATDRTSGYTFQLFDSRQEVIFKKSGIKERQFLCPLDSPQLKLKTDDLYYWTISREQMPIALFSFRIISPEKDLSLSEQIMEWEKRRLDFPVGELVLFQLFEDNGYYYDSYLLLHKLLKIYPDNRLFSRLLELYYASHFPEFADVLKKARS